MASLARSSYASVPFDRLDALRHQLLLQPDTGDHAATNDDPHRVSHATATDRSSSSKQATIPETVDSNLNAAPLKALSPPARLSTARPAPAGGKATEAMLQPSPSQQAFREFTRASSIPAMAYPGGDTQEMPSQVYRDFTATTSMAKPTTPHKKTLLKCAISPNGKLVYEEDSAGGTVEATPQTFVEGDTGFVDLEKALGDDWEVSPVKEDADAQVRIGENVQRQVPATPSLAGHKHGRDGELLTSAPTTHKKTPGFTQLFGGVGKTGLFTATQMFHETQAPSSPMPDGMRSDPVQTRPSPNVQNQQAISSPPLPTSSPAMTRNGRQSSVPLEPRDRYVSLGESQERRAAKLRREYGIDERFGTANEDDGFSQDTQQRRMRNERFRRVRSEQAMSEIQRVSAFSPFAGRPASCGGIRKSTVTIDLVTPAPERVVDYVPSDDSLAIAQEGHGEIDIEHEEHDMDDEVMMNINGTNDDENDGGHDYYDELAQTVLRSQSPAEDDEVEDLEGSGAEGDAAVEDHYAGPSDGDGANIPVAQSSQDQVDNDGSPTAPSNRISTQVTAVADSQPSGQAQPTSLLRQRPAEGSLLSSFVPGSQHAGKTSIDQAIIYSSSKQLALHASLPEDSEAEKIPSSPPLPGPRQTKLSPSATRRSSTAELINEVPRLRSALEVPESDLVTSDGAEQRRPSSRSANETGQGNSNQLFSTARSHVSGSGPSISPLKIFTSQKSKSHSQTPRTRAGVRHFSDIAGDNPTPRASGQAEIDIDAIMSDVVTEQDKELFEVLASPTSERSMKRRKTTHSSETATNRSPVKPSPRRKTMPFGDPEILSSPARHASQRAKPVTGHVEEEAPHIAAMSPTAQDGNVQEVLQENSNKANELRAATPTVEDAPDCTPDSVKAREEAGAKAASRLLSKRSSRAPKLSTRKPTTKPQKTYSAQHRRRSAPVQQEPSRQEDLMIDETASTWAEAGDHASADADEMEEPQQVINEQQPRVAPAKLNTTNRVFALFKGGAACTGFFPAIWLGNSPDGKKYRVRFEDGNETSVFTHQVARFELRIGDVVRIDLTNMRGKSWIIRKMGRPVRSDEDSGDCFDVNGYITVVVQMKKSAASATAKTKATENQDRLVDIPVSSIYLTQQMWPFYTPRTFTPPTSAAALSRQVTPLDGIRTPDVDTPNSRSRRVAMPSAKAVSERPSTLRVETIISSSPWNAEGIFSNMAFAISYGTNQAEKSNVTRLIVHNGGIVLEQGFEDLFDLPNLDDCTATPRKKLERSVGNGSLQLKPRYADLGFVALVADKHSRRAKYVQALALGLPTLSGRWVVDCLEPSRNATLSTPEAKPLAWEKYLLPAGESSYLNGAVRSRTLSAVYTAADSKLATTIANRPLLLAGEGVLIVAEKSTKNNKKLTWETRKTFAFLTLALGAGAVRRVDELAEAKAILKKEGDTWKWVYVAGDIGEAMRVLFGGGLKRKREQGIDSKAMVAVSPDGRVKVVNDEFVVQSLILGALVD